MRILRIQRLISRLAVGAFITIALAATVYNAQISAGISPNLPWLFPTLLILGLVSLVEPSFFLWDRFGPEKRERKTAEPIRSEEAYLTAKLREFKDQESRFVPLAGSTEIKLRYTDQTEKQTFEDIGEALAVYNKRFVLIGNPGAGKSTTMRHLFTEAANAKIAKPQDYPLPLWINLGLSSNPSEADDLLEFWWNEQAYLPGTAEQAIKQHNLIVFLDGLNEMPLGDRKTRAESLSKFIEQHPDLPIIVTCRVRDYEDDKSLNLDLPIVYVQELDDIRIQMFIKRYQADIELWEEIQHNHALKTLAYNPYNLAMLIHIYDEGKESLPKNLNSLYARYIQQAYDDYTNKRIKLKDAQNPLLHLDLLDLEDSLKVLAYRMIVPNTWLLQVLPRLWQLQNKGKIKDGTFAPYTWAQRQVGKRVLTDGLNLGVLVREGENIRFYHQSLHGYFAVELLGRELKNRSVEMKIALIRKIGDLGEAGEPTVQILMTFLREVVDQSDIRDEIVLALGKIGKPAVETLTEALRDKNWYIRAKVVETLGYIGTPSIKPLLVTLKDTNWYVRVKAVRALGQIANPSMVNDLIIAFQDTEWGVRAEAIKAFKQIGKPAIEALTDALLDLDWRVRWGAVLSLGQIGGDEVLAPLHTALQDNDWHVSAGAAQVLGQLHDPHAITPLMAILNNQKQDIYVRRAAAQALRKLGVDPDNLP